MTTAFKLNKTATARVPRPTAHKITSISQGQGQKQTPGTIAHQKTPKIEKVSQPKVRSLVQINDVPERLRSLQKFQKISSGVTVLIMAVTLTVYGWTTGEQAKWSQEYKKLENLRRQEQQLSVANELLKHQIAQQAVGKDAGLEQPRLNNLMFIQPAPIQRTSKSVESASKSREKEQYFSPKPLGY